MHLLCSGGGQTAPTCKISFGSLVPANGEIFDFRAWEREWFYLISAKQQHMLTAFSCEFFIWAGMF